MAQRTSTKKNLTNSPDTEVKTTKDVVAKINAQDKPVPIENLELDEKGRLWQHGLHEDTIFHNRLNFFIVIESAFLGIIGVLYSRNPDGEKKLLYVLVSISFVVTVFWLYIQYAHQRYISLIGKRCKENLPEFNRTLDSAKINKWIRIGSNTRKLAIFIPGIFWVIWTAALIYFLLM